MFAPLTAVLVSCPASYTRRHTSWALMNVTPEFNRATSAAPRGSLFPAELYATCRCPATCYPRCQHSAQLALFGHVRMSARTKSGSFRSRRRCLSLSCSPRAGATAGLSRPTAQRAHKSLQQICFAAAKQADMESLLLTYTPESISATDQEQTHLSQVLICNSQTLSAEVCL